MAKGPLRVAIEDLLNDNPVTNSIRDYAQRMNARQGEVNDFYLAYFKTYPAIALLTMPFWIGVGYIYVLSGWDFLKTIMSTLVGERPLIDASAATAKIIREAIDNPAIGELTEMVGALVTEPVLAILESEAARDSPDPKETARRFHGIMASLTAAGGVANISAEGSSAGIVNGVGTFFNQIYWTLGLGFLGWQTLAPLLESGLQPKLDRYYTRLYRPKRFSASELRDLYALGEIDKETLIEEARILGWRDGDIDQWVKLAFRSLSQGEVFELYQKGVLSQDEAVRRLRALGYAPDDIPLLFESNAGADVAEAQAVTLATAKAAYHDNLVSESDFRELLKQLNKSEREAELIVQLENAKKVQESRNLSIAQIRAAWAENVLSENEVRHWLGQEGFGTAEIDILLKTWQAEIIPTFRKLNRGTILQAYVNAILDRTQAAARLIGIGLTQEDATLELDLAETRNPEAFGKAKPKPAKELTPGVLGEMLAAGLIDGIRMKSRLAESGYSQEDADLYTRLATERATEAPVIPNQRTVERAYAALILDRTQANQALERLGFTREDSEVILNTVEQENPAVFFPSSNQATRLPSINSLVEAVRNEIITENDFYARAAEIGYSNVDAKMYLTLGRAAERKAAKTLTPAQIVNAYGAGIFERGEALARLTEQGYSDQDATILLRMEKSGITETDTWAAMVSGALDPEAGIMQLLSQGFSIEEINQAIKTLK